MKYKLKNWIKIELSDYATNLELKAATSANTTMFAKTTDLNNLKTDVSKSDLGSLQTVLGYIVVHDVFKKIFFDKLDLKVKEIETESQMQKYKSINNSRIQIIEDIIKELLIWLHNQT